MAQMRNRIEDNLPESPSGPRVRVPEPTGPTGMPPPMYDPTGGQPPGPLPDLDLDPTSREGETPRERTSTPRKPAEPAPDAGMTTTAPAGVVPFAPLGGSSEIGISSPVQAGLYGGRGGLTGGGLGVPLDPISNQKSPDIAGLLQMLMRGGR